MKSSTVECEHSPKRGFLLSTFLILMFMGNPLTAYIYFTNPEVVLRTYPAISQETVYLMGSLALANVVLAAGIWPWKKWGLYGFYAMGVIAFAINLYGGIGIKGALMGLLGVIVMYVLTRKHWPYFS